MQVESYAGVAITHHSTKVERRVKPIELIDKVTVYEISEYSDGPVKPGVKSGPAKSSN